MEHSQGAGNAVCHQRCRVVGAMMRRIDLPCLFPSSLYGGISLHSALLSALGACGVRERKVKEQMSTLPILNIFKHSSQHTLAVKAGKQDMHYWSCSKECQTCPNSLNPMLACFARGQVGRLLRLHGKHFDACFLLLEVASHACQGLFLNQTKTN